MISDATIVVGTPTGLLFHSMILNRPTICIGSYDDVNRLPFEQARSRMELFNLIGSAIANKDKKPLGELVSYIKSFLTGVPSIKN
ncbi:MAG: hypothetical protein Q8J97_09690, partial [Flavobacteriaceae bacterium]|nr:hypothetical protein [Flavobacteriaceae bacterium]